MAPTPRPHLGASFGAFESSLTADGRKVAIAESAAGVSLDMPIGPKFTLETSIGTVLFGTLRVDGVTHRVQPGVVTAVAGSYRFVDGKGWAPFVLGAVAIGQSFASTRKDADASAPLSRLVSSDLRLALVVGKRFGPVAPYLVARAFGGPVEWVMDGKNVVGGDDYHYQLGIGASVQLGPVDVSAEGAPLGERRYTFSVGVTL